MGTKEVVITARCALAAMTIAALGGCTSTNDGMSAGAAATADGTARAALYSPTGIAMGDATVVANTAGLTLTINGASLPQGGHGTHVHMVGKCDGPDFMTAGGHWNPAGKQHGTHNPAGPHAGDLPNLLIGTDGRGSLTIDILGARMTGEGGLLDADGAAIVVHANPDDNMTDPSGNSGGRIACGVFAAR